MLNHSSPYSELTRDQFCSFGRVIVESSNIEHLLEMIAIRLARAPSYPTIAITSQLGYVQKLKAVALLVDTHRRRYEGKFIPSGTLDELSSLLREVDSFRVDRNRCAHYLWCRIDDKTIFGIRLTGKHGGGLNNTEDGITLSVDELDSMASQMHRMVGGLLAVLETLPETEE